MNNASRNYRYRSMGIPVGNPTGIPAQAGRQSGEGCGSQNGCENLLYRIQVVDFSLVETVLYLDMYPDSAEALQYYHHLRAKRESLIREYESSCGPMTICGNESTRSWDWVKGPWPWEYAANPNLSAN